jgi:hypothetical protein
LADHLFYLIVDKWHPEFDRAVRPGSTQDVNNHYIAVTGIDQSVFVLYKAMIGQMRFSHHEVIETTFDLNNLACYFAMRLPVYPCAGFHIWTFHKAKYRTGRFIYPELMIFNIIVILNSYIRYMCPLDVINGNIGDYMIIHE